MFLKQMESTFNTLNNFYFVMQSMILKFCIIFIAKYWQSEQTLFRSEQPFFAVDLPISDRYILRNDTKFSLSYALHKT